MELTQAQIDDLRFRRRVVLPSFIAIIILSYIFFAFRFEIVFKRDYLDPNGVHGFVLEANPDEVEIQRFLFRAKLKNAAIFPKSKNFKVTSDTIYFSYNPINSFIQIYFGNNDVKIGDNENGIIISSPDQKYNFRAVLLDKDYDNLNFEFTASRMDIKAQKDLKQLYTSDDSKIKITSALGEEGFYRMEFNTEFENVNYSYNPKEYINYIKHNLIPNFVKNQPNYNETINYLENIYVLFGNLIGVSEPFKYKSNMSAKIPKIHVDNFANMVKGSLKPYKVIEQFNLNRENFSFNMLENGKSENCRFASSLKYSNDGNIINTIIGYTSTNEFDESIRTKMADLTVEYVKSNLIPLMKNYSVKGIEEITRKYMMSKSFAFNINNIYNVSNDTYTILTNNTVNDFGLKMETKLKDQDIESLVILSSPATLVTGIKKVYDSGLRSLILENFKIDPDYLDKLVVNINKNGLNFLNSFGKFANKGYDSKITADVSFKLDPEDLNLKVNGKNIDDIKEYKYVKKFLKYMPKNEPQHIELKNKDDK